MCSDAAVSSMIRKMQWCRANLTSGAHVVVQIKQLKEAKEPGGGGFGFIRACDRAADVFFHFSQLSDVAPADLAPGDDVEFTVVREPLPDAPKRIVAHRCVSFRCFPSAAHCFH